MFSRTLWLPLRRVIMASRISRTMPSAHHPDRKMAIARRENVINALLDVLTNDRISLEDLNHFRVVPLYFNVVAEKIDELAGCEEGLEDLQREILVAGMIRILEKLI